MVNICVITNCKNGYTKRKNKVEFIPEIFPVFGFPVNKAELNKKWIRFVNRKDWTVPKHSGICAKHFEEKFLKTGKRTTLRWELQTVPTIYPDAEFIPPSVLPTPKTSRKPPSRVVTLPDQIEEFTNFDKIADFTSTDESFCPSVPVANS